jgi:hypothetical protein
MRNPLRRIVDRRPAAATAGGDMAWSMRRNAEPISPLPPDDYHVEGETQVEQPTVAARVVHGLQIVLIIVLALLSFAVFWLIGLTLNIL